jgi:3-phosphoshikimate 1-carboxyvinyltransferase
VGCLTVGRVRHFWGEIRPPSDKSLTHRAYLLSAIANQGGWVGQPLQAEDCDNTLKAIAALGVPVKQERRHVVIEPTKLTSPEKRIWCGNSGTLIRLLSGLIAPRSVTAILDGDASLRKRPMRRITEPLRNMGANIEGETAPLKIQPADLKGIQYDSPVASAQVKSALLLAGLNAEGETMITEPSLSRDHTERMLTAAGCSIETISSGRPTVKLKAGDPYRIEMNVPGDISSAAFFLVAGALLGGPITILSVGVNPTRTGILKVLQQAGVAIEIYKRKEEQGEPVADIFCEGAHDGLRPFKIGGEIIPQLIDELPILAIMATQCSGTSIITDAAELRVKESDRIEAIVGGLKKMGADIEATQDGMIIKGPTPLKGTKINANNDHRIAMSFAIAGLIADDRTDIIGSETIATSFPSFEDELRRLSHVG